MAAKPILYCFLPVALLLAAPQTASATCDVSPSSSGVLDADNLKFYLGGSFAQYLDGVEESIITDAVRAGALKWNQSYCRPPKAFAWAYEGWGVPGFDSGNSTLTIELVYQPGFGDSCAVWNSIANTITFYGRRSDEEDRLCPLAKIQDDLMRSLDPYATGAYESLMGVASHEVGHALGLGEDYSENYSCVMSGLERKNRINRPDYWHKSTSNPDGSECSFMDRVANSEDENFDECDASPDCLIDPGGVNPTGLPSYEEGRRPHLNIPDITFVDLEPVPVVTIGGIQYKCWLIVFGSTIICVKF